MRSTCIDLCAFDGKTGWCRGCGRTLQETRRWRKAQPHELRKITAELPRRLTRLKARG